jgi:hypothetical protein
VPSSTFRACQKRGPQGQEGGFGWRCSVGIAGVWALFHSQAHAALSPPLVETAPRGGAGHDHLVVIAPTTQPHHLLENRSGPIRPTGTPFLPLFFRGQPYHPTRPARAGSHEFLLERITPSR